MLIRKPTASVNNCGGCSGSRSDKTGEPGSET